MWTYMKEIFHKNETLLNNIQNLQQKQQQEDEKHDGIESLEPQPFSIEILNTLVPNNFKYSSLAALKKK